MPCESARGTECERKWNEFRLALARIGGSCGQRMRRCDLDSCKAGAERLNRSGLRLRQSASQGRPDRSDSASELATTAAACAASASSSSSTAGAAAAISATAVSATRRLRCSAAVLRLTSALLRRFGFRLRHVVVDGLGCVIGGAAACSACCACSGLGIRAGTESRGDENCDELGMHDGLLDCERQADARRMRPS